MKRILSWLLFVLYCWTGANIAWAAAPDAWLIDREIRFHHAYFNPTETQDPSRIETPAPAGFTSAFTPDITNISLSALVDMGFPFQRPSGPEPQKFFLKFYQFPASVDPQITANRILSEYLLYKLTGPENVVAYAGHRENLWIKDGHIAPAAAEFSRERPFPPLRVRIDRLGGRSTQAQFDRLIPFSSLYVKPTAKAPPNLSRDQQAAWSTSGLVALHQELEKIYQDSFNEVQGDEPDKYRYFVRLGNYSGQNDRSNELLVLRLPRHPLIFDNYANLPMPQDPARFFLTGLVLISKTIYAGEDPLAVLSGNIRVGSASFSTAYTELSSHVLEIGSVVTLPRPGR